MARKITLSKLRTIRHSVAYLKAKGLVSKEIDARKVQPSQSISKLLNKYKDVISKESSVISASRVHKIKTADLHKIGARLARPKNQPAKLIVSKTVIGSTITTKKKNILERVLRPDGTRKIDKIRLPNDIDTFVVSDLDPELLPSPTDDTYFSFRLGGNKAINDRTFRTPQLMMEYLSRYMSYGEDPEEFVEALEIYRFYRVEQYYDLANHTSGRQSRAPKKPSPAKAKKQRAARWARTPKWKQNDLKEKHKQASKEYRKKLKSEGGAKYEEYKRKAKARAKKSK